MIITVKKGIPEEEVKKLVHTFEERGFQVNDSQGTDYHIVGLIGDTTSLDEKIIQANPLVSEVTRIAAPYKKANRMFHQEDTVVDVAGVKIGGQEKIVVIGGPCSVESREQICEIAKEVKAAGADMLRGGAYKPRTSPYSFQGLETEGIKDMVEARRQTGLPIVSELMDAEHIEEFVEHVDLIQIGARNMQNFDLLRAVGRLNVPVLLKRGLSATIDEWLMSAEYIMSEGNQNVILCERGIRTFEKATRNTMDLSAVTVVKRRSHLPVIVDPSHATGHRWMVEDMAMAAIAAGADGIMCEVHNDPEHAWCDGAESITPETFDHLMGRLRQLAPIVGREL